MRNFNTSFIKNATSIFAIEANDVLRTFAFANPATYLLRLIQSAGKSPQPVESDLGQKLRQRQTQSTLGQRSEFGRVLSVVSVSSLESMPGYGSRNCWLSHSSS